MTSSDVSDAIAFLSVAAPDVADRIRSAGFRGASWPLQAVEFSNLGIPPHQMQAMVNVSSLAACELQCAVEAFAAERRGGVYIKC